MNLSVIKHELQSRRWSIMWWSIGIAVLIALTLSFYPSFKDQSSELQQAFTDIPDSAMALLSDTGDFFSPVGYLSSQLFYAVLPMTVGILGISLGSSLIAKEEKDGTIELLLSRPLSRTKLLFSKFISGGLILGIVGTVTALSTLLIAVLAGIEVGKVNILLASLVCILMTAAFGSIAFLFSITGRARVASIGIATLYALGGYVISSLSGVVEWLKWPSKVFAFTYYKPAEILEGTYAWSNLTVFAGIILVCILASWVIFRRRDLVS